jgi:enterochelin esterase-like enzyme
MTIGRNRDTSFRAWLRTAVISLVLLPVSACRFHRVAPWERTPLREGQVEKVRLTESADFFVDRVRFFSEELQEPRFFLILTPAADPNVRNVLILNHGWSDRPEDLMTSLGVDATYAGLLGRRRVSSARLVLPDIRFPAVFRRTERRYPFRQYLVLVGEEVPGLVSRLYDIPFDRERWGIGGFSFGGYVSLDVARRYPGRFGSVSVVSSFYEDDWTFWPSELPPIGPVDSRGRGKQNIVLPGPIPRLMLACGTHDRFVAQMRALHTRFSQLGIRHEWATAAGGHTWTYWKAVLPSVLAFHLPPDGDQRGIGR